MAAWLEVIVKEDDLLLARNFKTRCIIWWIAD
jgi:hypothetical protein